MRASKLAVGRAGVIGLCAGAGFAWSSAQAAQVTAQWLAPVNGSWIDATKWSGGQFPNNGNPVGTTYHAVIDAAGATYSVTLQQAITLDRLTVNATGAILAQTGGMLTLLESSTVEAGRYMLTGGTLSGPGDLTVDGEFRWTNGVLQGEGALVATEASLVRFSGSSSRSLQRTMDMRGEALWEGGFVFLEHGTLINSGSMLASGPSTMQGVAGGSFINDGTLTLSHSGTITFNGGGALTIINNGLIRQDRGVVQLDCNVQQMGALEILLGATLRTSAGFVLGEDATIAGDGTLEYRAGAHVLDERHSGFTGSLRVSGSAALDVQSPMNVSAWEFNGGSVNFQQDVYLDTVSLSSNLGGQADFAFGDLLWRQGAMDGDGESTIVEGGSLRFALSFNPARSLSRKLTNLGEATLESGSLVIDGGVFVNDHLLIASGSTSFFAGDAGGVFINNGELRTAGAGVIGLLGDGLEIQNNGVMRIEPGTTLRVSDVSAIGVALGGGTLSIGGGDGVFDGAAKLDVSRIEVFSGRVVFEQTPQTPNWTFAGGEAIFQSVFDAGDLLLSSGGAVRFSGGVHLNADAALSVFGGGAFDFASQDVAADQVQLHGGTISGEGDVIALSGFGWSEGTMEGSGRTIVAAGAMSSLNLFTPATLARELLNLGEMSIAGAPLRVENGTLRNAGVITVAGYIGAPMEFSGLQSGGAILNEGTLVKEGPGGVRLLSNGGAMSFQNTGLLDVREGLVRLEGEAVTTNEGTYAMSHSGSVHVGGGFVNTSGATLAFEGGAMKDRGLSGLMTITGEASLAGTLTVTTPEAFSATWGDRWVVISYGSVEGDFDVFDLPTDGFASRSDDFGASDLRWYAERGETEYAVGVSHVADIDHDGLIGFGDLNIIASNFNAPGSWAQGDVDGDGFVGFTDLNAVLSLFNVAAPRSVPGPGTVFLAAAAGMCGVRRNRGSGAPVSR